MKPISVFKQLRTRTGMTQREFSEMLGIAIETLSRWENGHYEPTLNLRQIKILNIYMKGLGLSIDDLPDDPKGILPKVVYPQVDKLSTYLL